MSPTLFNLHMSETEIDDDTLLNTLFFFADNKVLLSGSENDLQNALYVLHIDTKQYGMIISSLKTEVMVFKGKVTIKSKIVIGNTVLQQVNTYTYMGCKILYKEEIDITSKISKCLHILVTLNNVSKWYLV
jgi:hypothetical protein